MTIPKGNGTSLSMIQTKTKDLGLGDVVSLSIDKTLPYDTATVYRKLENGDCMVWRPYVHTSDFSYGDKEGSVIPYLGIEDFTLSANTDVWLLQKKARN